MSGSKNSYIATLVERHTRYVMLAKVANKDTQTVISALIKQAKKLPNELYKSLTWDRGKELTDHRRFTLATNIAVYFCDPQNPWQRGSNENTNGLLRQYFPKGTDLSVHSQLISTKWRVSSMSGHGRPCNLKRRQRDLMPVLCRSGEAATNNGQRSLIRLRNYAAIDPKRSCQCNFRF